MTDKRDELGLEPYFSLADGGEYQAIGETLDEMKAQAGNAGEGVALVVDSEGCYVAIAPEPIARFLVTLLNEEFGP